MANALYQDIKYKFLPERKAKVRYKSLPWMNGGIRKLMNQRYQQLLKAQRTGSSEDRLKYKELRNKVIKALRSAEAEYWTNMLSTTSKGSKDFWKIMNQLTRRGKSNMRMGPVRNSNDVLVYDDHEKSATINSFFATVGEKLASNFPTTTVDGLSLISRITPTISDISFAHEVFCSKLAKLNI